MIPPSTLENDNGRSEDRRVGAAAARLCGDGRWLQKVLRAPNTGGFGSVYKGSLTDGTLVAVKILDRVLPHGQKEFIHEVNTIGSMHHMNLVRLCDYCSEGSQRLPVYEFMKNGSLDKWIFPSSNGRDRLLDWEIAST